MSVADKPYRAATVMHVSLSPAVYVATQVVGADDVVLVEAVEDPVPAGMQIGVYAQILLQSTNELALEIWAPVRPYFAPILLHESPATAVYVETQDGAGVLEDEEEELVVEVLVEELVVEVDPAPVGMQTGV